MGTKLLKVPTSHNIRIDYVKIKYLEGWRQIQVIFDIKEKANYFFCDDLCHL